MEEKHLRRQINLYSVSSTGFVIVFSLAACLAAGFFLDRWFGTRPVFLFLMFFVGIFAAGWTVYKEVRAIKHG
jgi:F0F1-type ATP synthase assembly protein I